MHTLLRMPKKMALQWTRFSILMLIAILCLLQSALAMHIAEGFLPVGWSLFWTGVMVPIVAVALKRTRKQLKGDTSKRYLFGVMVAFAFTLSSLKMPSVMGSSSHPTGVGLGAVLLGPSAMVLIGLVVLIFQTLLLAHGGITTLGANSFTMAFFGPVISYFVYKGLSKVGASKNLCIFFAATLGNWATYIATSAQLALAFPDPASGFVGALVKFLGVFAVTQVPIAIVEGLLTVAVFHYITGLHQQDTTLTSGEVG